MPWHSLLGNQRVKHYLTRIYQTNRVGNSLLFAGPEGIGKGLFAKAFAQLLLGKESAFKIEQGNHPDLRLYYPEGKLALHSIDSMRSFSKEVFDTPFEAKKRVFIFHDAERMLPVSANALLKTFEEPALDSIIILLSSSPEELLPTIRSRCQMVPFVPLSQAEICTFLQQQRGKSLEESLALANLAQGSLGKALRLAEGEKTRNLLLQLLSKGRLATHTELLQQIKEIVASVDLEDGFKDKNEEPEQLSAYQKEREQKELEGAISLKKYQGSQMLFEIILSWYRDQQLLKETGALELLFNHDRLTTLQAVSKDDLPLETVYKAIEEAQLSLQRSTALPLVLENLFLKLNFL